MKQALVSDLSLPLSSVYPVPPLRHRPLPLGVGLFYGERGSSISCMLVSESRESNAVSLLRERGA